MSPDLVLRAVLSTEAFLVLVLAAHFVGPVWSSHHIPKLLKWPVRIVIVGAGGLLVYMLAGQYKAVDLKVPFDAFSMIGLVSYSVVLLGFALIIRHERRNRRGR